MPRHHTAHVPAIPPRPAARPLSKLSVGARVALPADLSRVGIVERVKATGEAVVRWADAAVSEVPAAFLCGAGEATS